MKSAKQAMENVEYVRRLLGQKQPGFAASLEFAVSLAETSMEKPMDDELIRLCAAPARGACLRMTPRYLNWSRPELRRRKRLGYTPWFRRSPDPTPRCTRPPA
jgi:hypothetical protein